MDILELLTLYLVCYIKSVYLKESFLFDRDNTEIHDSQVFHSDLLHHRIPEVTKEHVLSVLDNKSFCYLRQSLLKRTFVNRSELTPGIVNVLCEVLKNGSIPRDLENESIRKCYDRGWLHSELLDLHAWEDDEIVCVFPTRLHAK